MDKAQQGPLILTKGRIFCSLAQPKTVKNFYQASFVTLILWDIIQNVKLYMPNI